MITLLVIPVRIMHKHYSSSGALNPGVLCRPPRENYSDLSIRHSMGPFFTNRI